MPNYEKTDLTSTLNYIKSEYGLNPFIDGKIIAFLADLAPSLKREKSLLKKLVDKGLLKEIVENVSANENEQRRIFFKAKCYLIDEECLQEDFAIANINILAKVFGYGITLQASGQNSHVDSDKKDHNTLSELIQTVNPMQTSSASSVTERAFMCLEDGDYQKADDLLEQALNTNPKYGWAYLGKLLVELKLKTIEQLNDFDKPYENNKNYQRAVKYGDEALKKKLNDFVEEKKEAKRLIGLYDRYIKEFNNSKTEKDYEIAANHFNQISHFKDSKYFEQRCYTEINRIRNEKEKLYLNALSCFNNAVTIPDFEKAKSIFSKIKDYKDANKYISECENKIKQILLKEKNDLYDKLVNQFENSSSKEEFEKLKKDFQNLSPFKDSSRYVSECENKINEILLKEKNELYDKLVNQFENSSDKEEFEQLKKDFQNLSPFKDSSQYASEFENKKQEIVLKEKNDLYEKLVNQFENSSTIEEFEKLKIDFYKFNKFNDSEQYISKCEIKIKEIWYDKYDKAVISFQSANTKEEFEEIKKDFENIFENIGQFKDSTQYINECENQMKKITRRKIRRICLSVLLFFIVIFLYDEAISLYDFHSKYSIYNSALDLLNAKKYEEAITKFEQIKSFKDSGDKIKECEFGVKNVKYDIALNLLNAKKYDEALPIFGQIIDYKDSSSIINEITKKQLYDFIKTFEIKMAVCLPGNFTMGSPNNEKGRDNNEIQHIVVISQPFAIGKYEVTQAQYSKIMGKNPSSLKGENNPVEQVSWDDAKAFCDKLNTKFASKLPNGYKFDLPTEAQWEYACRAGTTSALNNGKDLTSEIGRCYNLDEVAWYAENSDGKTHSVGQKKPNAWGVYDMHGNVFEWCRDWYGDYPTGNVTDPVGPSTGLFRVIRGSGWLNNPSSCRSAYRGNCNPNYRNIDLGFRLALVPIQ